MIGFVEYYWSQNAKGGPTLTDEQGSCDPWVLTEERGSCLHVYMFATVYLGYREQCYLTI